MTYVLGLAGPGSLGVGKCSDCGWWLPQRGRIWEEHIRKHETERAEKRRRMSRAAKKGWTTRRRIQKNKAR